MQNLKESERPQGQFIRSLDQAEANFWLYDRASSMNFCVMAEGEGSFSEESLRKALDLIQNKHALAKVQILKQAGQDSHLYFATSDKKIPIQKDLYSPDWKSKLAKETIRLFELGDSPLIRTIFYTSGNSKFAIGVIFHHSIGDGRSGCRFLLDVLRASTGEADEIEEDSEYSSLMELYPAEELYKGGPKPEKPLTIPQFSRKKEEQDPEIISFYLEEEDVNSLLKTSKQKKISFHGILGASQVTALADFFDRGQEGVLYLSTPADLRPHLSHPVPDSALGLYISLFTTPVNIRDPFDIKAKAIMNDVRARIGRREGRAFYELLPPSEQFLEKEDGLKLFQLLMNRNPQSSLLSNVGIIPVLASDEIKVKELSFTVHPALTQTIFTTVTTYENRMAININYDKNRWKEADISQFAYSFRKNILSNS
ncbi:phthiocerol/phthiodiolone dimycocerosyl transferase family protein [Leptospira dzoumogneensis]|uniref:Phthiocerol/phthiodiolone dimycocerosyl transferase n=1 Tax=Leptospira dzoumogneensis TaxID=2484904 RepID=A0A4Z1AHE7_9LEPT|nr:condensation protein [Leptospira dzoumogneensis]TGN03473.1 condensation protein [Leptospira dzoumogneensis]